MVGKQEGNGTMREGNERGGETVCAKEGTMGRRRRCVLLPTLRIAIALAQKHAGDGRKIGAGLGGSRALSVNCKLAFR